MILFLEINHIKIMSVVKELQKCPYCKEAITQGASICKHCQSVIEDAKRPAWHTAYNNFRFGFLVGILFSAIMLFIIYYHFYMEH